MNPSNPQRGYPMRNGTLLVFYHHIYLSLRHICLYFAAYAKQIG
jgi:hypothetical protein